MSSFWVEAPVTGSVGLCSNTSRPSAATTRHVSAGERGQPAVEVGVEPPVGHGGGDDLGHPPGRQHRAWSPTWSTPTAAAGSSGRAGRRRRHPCPTATSGERGRAATHRRQPRRGAAPSSGPGPVGRPGAPVPASGAAGRPGRGLVLGSLGRRAGWRAARAWSRPRGRGLAGAAGSAGRGPALGWGPGPAGQVPGPVRAAAHRSRQPAALQPAGPPPQVVEGDHGPVGRGVADAAGGPDARRGRGCRAR